MGRAAAGIATTPGLSTLVQKPSPLISALVIPPSAMPVTVESAATTPFDDTRWPQFAQKLSAAKT